MKIKLIKVERASQTRSRVYVSFDGAASNPKRRLEQLRFALRASGYPNADAVWKRTAGCSCGCSPGFVLDVAVRDDGKVCDVFVDA